MHINAGFCDILLSAPLLVVDAILIRVLVTTLMRVLDLTLIRVLYVSHITCKIDFCQTPDLGLRTRS